MVTWGLISMAMAFVTGPTSFYVLRFLLGVAEAGFFPGMVLYLTYWFPEQRARGRSSGLFIIANPASTVHRRAAVDGAARHEPVRAHGLADDVPRRRPAGGAARLRRAVRAVRFAAKAKWLSEREREALLTR